jgi:hypothetical protein
VDRRSYLFSAITAAYIPTRLRQRAEPGGAMPVSAALIRELEELVAALDKRVPRVEHAGEAAIARDAAALRAKAIERLTQLATDPAVRAARDPGDPK